MSDIAKSIGGPLGIDIPGPFGGPPRDTLLKATIDHKNRVEGDGGTVDDADWLDSHIRILQDLGWYSQLVGAWDPAGGIQRDGSGLCQTLYDIGPNNFDLTQATASKRPRPNNSYRAWSNPYWGDSELTALHFDATDDVLTHPDASALQLGPNTAFWVMWLRVASNGLNGNQAFGKKRPSTSEAEFSMRARDSVETFDMNVHSSGSAGGDDAGANFSKSGGDWMMFYGAYDDTDNAETVIARSDNTNEDTDTVANSPNAGLTAPFEYGAIEDLGEYWEGALGIMLYVKRPNRTDDLPHVNGELKTYYDKTRNRVNL